MAEAAGDLDFDSGCDSLGSSEDGKSPDKTPPVYQDVDKQKIESRPVRF